jgi:hypothetical protein
LLWKGFPRWNIVGGVTPPLKKKSSSHRERVDDE